MDAARNFAEVKDYASARECVSKLYLLMKKGITGLKQYELALLSTHVLHELRQAAEYHTFIRAGSQICYTNDHGHLSCIIARSLSCYLQYPQRDWNWNEVDMCKVQDRCTDAPIVLHIRHKELKLNWVKSLIDLFSIKGTQIHNIVFWSWQDLPGSLTSFNHGFLYKGLTENFSKVTIQLNGDRYISHSTTVESFISMLKELEDGRINFVANKSSPVYPKPVYLRVCLTDDEFNQVPEAAKRYAGESPQHENLFGTVNIKFQLKSIFPRRDKGFCVWTKLYKYEYVQTLFIPDSRCKSKYLHVVEARGVKSNDAIDINKYEWNLRFSDEKYWTLAELAVAGDLKVAINDVVSVTFVNHGCPSARRDNCTDCKSDIAGDSEKSKKKFIQALKANPDQYLELIETWVNNPALFPGISLPAQFDPSPSKRYRPDLSQS
jgi:hypothetical protein